MSKKILAKIIIIIMVLQCSYNGVLAATKPTNSLYENVYNILLKADKINQDFQEDVIGIFDKAQVYSGKYIYSKKCDCATLETVELLEGKKNFYANDIHNQKKIKVFSVKGNTETSITKQKDIVNYFGSIIHNSFIDMNSKLLKPIVYSSKIQNVNNVITINVDKVPDNIIGDVSKQLGEDNKLFNIKFTIVIDNGKLKSIKVSYNEKDEEMPQITDEAILYYKITYNNQNIKPYQPKGNTVSKLDPFKSSCYKLDSKKEALVNKKANEILRQIIKPSMNTQLEKFIVIYKYLSNNTQYDYLDLTKNNGINCNEYELLINGYGLDASYAQALKRLCNLAGIECEVVTGINDITKKHCIWNAVKIDGKWNYADIGIDMKNRNLFMGMDAEIDMLISDTSTFKADRSRSDGKVQNYNNLEKLDLFKDEHKEYLMYKDGYVYYALSGKNYMDNEIDRVKCDGSDKSILSKGFSSYYCTSDGNDIYYSTISGDENSKTTYRIITDENKCIKISDKGIIIFKVIDGWIYYELDNRDGIYRMKNDGTNNSKISSRDCSKMYISNGYIFIDCTVDAKFDNLYRMNLDGGNEKLLYNGFAYVVGKKMASL